MEQTNTKLIVHILRIAAGFLIATLIYFIVKGVA